MNAGNEETRAERLRFLLLVVLGAVIVRGLLFGLRADYLDWDEALYILMARNVLEGSGITLNGYPHVALGPLVPLATALISLFSGLEPLIAHHVLMVLAGSALIIPVYYLLDLNTGVQTARIASILIVGWPALIDVSPKLGPMWRHVYAGTEPVFLLLLFASLALGEVALRSAGVRRYALLGLAGISLALGYLTRPEAIVIAAVYAAIRCLPWFRTEPLAGLGQAFAVVALGFVLAAGPFLYHTRQVTGTWTPSGKFEPTRLSADLYQNLVLSDRHMGPYLKTWWALEPGHAYLLNPYWGAEPSTPTEDLLVAFEARLNDVWSPSSFVARSTKRAGAYTLAMWSLLGPMFVALAVIGVLKMEGGWARRFPPFVGAAFLASALTAALVFALPRFFLYLIPALALWAAEGVIAISRFAGTRGWKIQPRALAVAVTAAGLALAAARTLGDESSQLRQVAIENRLASKRLAEAVPAKEAVITWHPRLAYWGGWDWRALPVAPIEDVAHYAASRGIRYMFLAQGMYAPIQLKAPYVLFVVDPDFAAAASRRAPSGRDHEHPPMALTPIEPVAGFPTGSIEFESVEPPSVGGGS